MYEMKDHYISYTKLRRENKEFFERTLFAEAVVETGYVPLY